MAEKWHSGITMHKLSFGSGFIGLLFAAGSALIFVLGFPTLWYFVALAFAYEPWHDSLRLGQQNGIVFFFIALTAVALLTRRDTPTTEISRPTPDDRFLTD